MQAVPNWVLIGAILAGLWAFGWWYNRWIEKMGEDLDGFLWLAVILGTLATLIGIGLLDLLVDWNAGLTGLLCFAASGFEMSRGAVMRYLERRHRLMELDP